MGAGGQGPDKKAGDRGSDNPKTAIKQLFRNLIMTY